MGHQNRALRDRDDIAGAGFAKTHLQPLGFGLVAEAQASAATVAPGPIGNDVIHVVSDQAGQCAAFTFLL